MDSIDIAIETTYKTNGKPYGWKGYGSVEHSCGLWVDVGTGEHDLIEKLHCPHCGNSFEVDWTGIVEGTRIF